MAAKPETAFRLRIERGLPREIHREKMANPYRGGTADCWYSARRSDLWVEYKFLPRIPQKGVVDAKRLGLSHLQLQWLHGRYEEGRNVSVIVGVPTGGVILRDLDWEKEILAGTFAGMVIPHTEVTAWITQTTLR